MISTRVTDDYIKGLIDQAKGLNQLLNEGAELSPVRVGSTSAGKARLNERLRYLIGYILVLEEEKP